MERNERSKGSEVAIFAAGCFWGVEEILRGIDGVKDTEVGYTGGTLQDPTYEDVIRGDTEHAEAIQITFDPEQISYEKLLDYFFRLHDPTTKNRSLDWVSATASAITSVGIGCPNEIVAGLSGPPHKWQSGAASPSSTRVWMDVREKLSPQSRHPTLAAVP